MTQQLMKTSLNKEDNKNKALNAEEKFVAQLIWGAVPTDIAFVRESKLFKDGIERFKTYAYWQKLFNMEKNNKQ